MEPPDRMADGGQHALHLVRAPLVEDELHTAVAEATGTGGRGASVLELDSALERRERLA